MASEIKDMEDWKVKILDSFCKGEVKAIRLVGKPGTGKTWRAREIIDCAISKNLLSKTIWIYMNKKYQKMSVYENIANQLSLFPSAGEWVDDDEGKEELTEDQLKMMPAKLDEIIASHEDKKFILLVLDDVRDEEDEGKILLELKNLLHSLRVIITRSESGSDLTVKYTSIEYPSTTKNADAAPRDSVTLPSVDLETLLRENVNQKVHGFPGFGQLAKKIIEKSQGLPSAIISFADTLNYIVEHSSGSMIFESASGDSSNDAEVETKVTRLLYLLHSWYELLSDSVIINCCWHSKQLLCKHGGVNYNELIAHWIIEGYFGHFDHIQKAYDEGHRVLMKLIDSGALKKQEDNVIIMEGATLDMTDQRRGGFGGTSCLGLINVIEVGNLKRLGKLTQEEGMMKSLCGLDKWKEVSTLLIDRNRLCREVPEKFFMRMESLQVLALFNSKFKTLPNSLSKLGNLLVLVLRGCELLDNIDNTRTFRNLKVLEISSAGSLMVLPDDLFEQMSDLRILNLSSIPFIKFPPLSKQSELRSLILRRCFNLKTVPSLKPFPKLEIVDLSGSTSFIRFQDRTFGTLEKLQTLDLSGTLIDKIPYFKTHDDLKRILLSGCKHVSRLPSLRSLTSLQILDISDAVSLKEIPDDSPLTSLRILNLSGAVLLDKIPEECLTCLEILDLSNTAVSVVPSKITTLRKLTLKDCSELKKLSSTTELENLELLDLSGSSGLVEIVDKSFEHLRYLQCLNLSKTNIEILPSISNLGNLHEILLNDCFLLKQLPEMNGLKRLEVLDLSGTSSLKLVHCEHLNHRNLQKLLFSGCKNLNELTLLPALENLVELDLSGCIGLGSIPNSFFDHMSQLQRLNLSETKIEGIPSLSSLSNLRHLLLRDCVNLEKLPSLASLLKLLELDVCGARKLEVLESESIENMIHLQILCLCGPALKEIPFLSKLTKLSHLSLRGCLNLETIPNFEALTHLEVLDLSETKIEGLLSLDSLINLRKLLLRGCSCITRLSLPKSRSSLEHIDLWGTGIGQFPYGISQLTCLKHLDLPDLKEADIEWENIRFLPAELNWDQCGIFTSSVPVMQNARPSILVTGAKGLQLLENFKLWETCFRKFDFSVRLRPSIGSEDECTYCDRDEPKFRDVYCAQFSYPEELLYQSLEILGSYKFPGDFRNAIKNTEYLSLIDNMIIEHLSELEADLVKGMKGFRLEGCTKIQSILRKKDIDDGLGENIEIVRVSNLPSLSSIYSIDVKSEGFKKLKHLHLDCCPKLEHVFSSSQLPELLETLKIKFCDNLKTVFEKCGNSLKFKLVNFRTLDLFELPKLETIGGELPFSTVVTYNQCLQLKYVANNGLENPSAETIITE